MAISLQGFKEFAKINQDEKPAVQATGIVTFTKNPPGNNVIQIPAGIEIHTPSQTYVTIESEEINESQTFIPVVCRAKVGGEAGNVGRNQIWSTALAGVSVTNPQSVFSGGRNALPSLPSCEGAVEWTLSSDDLLQSNIDLGIQNVKTKLAYSDDEDLPDVPGVDRSVYLFALFYTQNRDTQHTETKFGGGRDDSLSKSRNVFYREKVFTAINREVDNLLRPYVRVSAFMPDVPGVVNG